MGTNICLEYRISGLSIYSILGISSINLTYFLYKKIRITTVIQV